MPPPPLHQGLEACRCVLLCRPLICMWRLQAPTICSKYEHGRLESLATSLKAARTAVLAVAFAVLMCALEVPVAAREAPAAEAHNSSSSSSSQPDISTWRHSSCGIGNTVQCTPDIKGHTHWVLLLPSNSSLGNDRHRAISRQ